MPLAGHDGRSVLQAARRSSDILWVARARWRAHGLRLFVTFQLAALVPVLAVGVLLDRQLASQQTGQTLDNGRAQAEQLADLVVAPRLGAGDLRSADADSVQARLRSVIESPVLRRETLRVKVWDASGRVVASDAPDLVGKRFPLDEDVERALHGTPSAAVSALTAAENGAERGFGKAVEVYVPIRADQSTGHVTGAFEVYLPYAPLARMVHDSQLTVEHEVAAGLGVLMLALSAATWPVLRRLRREAVAAQDAVATDSLTGLRSRVGFATELATAVADDEPALVVVGNLDGLRRINEALGHDAGDELLRHVAGVLVEHSPGATVARFGGDEFAVLLRRGDGVQDPMAVMTRLRTAVMAEVELCQVPVAPLLSIGCAAFPEQGRTVRELLQHAESAVQSARAVPDGVALYDPRKDPFDVDQLRLMTEVRRAVAGEQLVIHFQPQARASDGVIVAAEALVRWQHPERGLLMPGAFLPQAERTGFVVAVTRWVLGAVAAQLAADGEGQMQSVSVNISARDLADPGFAGRSAATMRDAGVPTSRVCLELTETALIDDPAGARAVLVDLATAGFRLSLDDFGQGYTSLGQLRDLPLDEIKLDRAFVAGMTEHSADRAIVDSVVRLAHNLGLQVVAEGVETAQQYAMLREMGYDVMQGWYVGRPAPVTTGAVARTPLPRTAPAPASSTALS